MKLSINKLIANDIINYGMDKASETNYVVSLNTYLEDFDKGSKKYILDNIDEIINDIEANENVADLEIEEDEYGKHFDMIFYWGKLLNQIENIIYEVSKNEKVELDLNDIRNIADEVIYSDAFNSDIENRINSYDNGRDY